MGSINGVSLISHGATLILIGILGGTFDPIHYGHLRIALEAMEEHKLSEVRFVPCKLPVHKKAPIASKQDRLKMLRLALNSDKRFKCDSREMERNTPSYMIETLESLQQETNEPLGLIVGSDILPTLSTWHRWEEITKRAKLLVMPRILPISSTQIREILKNGKNPAYLLPNNVLDYIHQNRVYF